MQSPVPNPQSAVLFCGTISGFEWVPRPLSVLRRSMFETLRSCRACSLMAMLVLCLAAVPAAAQAPAPAPAQQAPAAPHVPGGEANLVLPDLGQVDFNGINGRTLL